MGRPVSSEHRDLLGVHAPQWLDRAVLGIFIHWGAYSVPAWAEPHGELGTEPDEATWFTHNAYAEWYFNTIRILSVIEYNAAFFMLRSSFMTI